MSSVLRTTIVCGVEVQVRARGAHSYWPDGSHYGAHPHDNEQYDEACARVGLSPELPGPTYLARARQHYCVEHEVAHHLMWYVNGTGSGVLRALARGARPEPSYAVMEEATVHLIQRYLWTGKEPLIDHVAWAQLRDEGERAMYALGFLR